MVIERVSQGVGFCPDYSLQEKKESFANSYILMPLHQESMFKAIELEGDLSFLGSITICSSLEQVPPPVTDSSVNTDAHKTPFPPP